MLNSWTLDSGKIESGMLDMPFNDLLDPMKERVTRPLHINEEGKRP